jgi:hypothetical protein
VWHLRKARPGRLRSEFYTWRGIAAPSPLESRQQVREISQSGRLWRDYNTVLMTIQVMNKSNTILTWLPITPLGRMRSSGVSTTLPESSGLTSKHVDPSDPTPTYFSHPFTNSIRLESLGYKIQGPNAELAPPLVSVNRTLARGP